MKTTLVALALFALLAATVDGKSCQDCSGCCRFIVSDGKVYVGCLGKTYSIKTRAGSGTGKDLDLTCCGSGCNSAVESFGRSYNPWTAEGSEIDGEKGLAGAAALRPAAAALFAAVAAAAR